MASHDQALNIYWLDKTPGISQLSPDIFGFTKHVASHDQASKHIFNGTFHTLSACGFDAKVQFDPRSTHSFVALAFVLHVGEDKETLPYDLIVATPVGRSVPRNVVYPRCSVQIREVRLNASLIILPMLEFDVIVGMNCLAANQAVLDCFNKTVRLQGVDSSVEFVGLKKSTSTRLISALKAERLRRSGYEGFIVFIMEDKESKTVDEIPVVREFPDLFLDEIPGLPPVRELDFTIVLGLSCICNLMSSMHSFHDISWNFTQPSLS